MPRSVVRHNSISVGVPPVARTTLANVPVVFHGPVSRIWDAVETSRRATVNCAKLLEARPCGAVGQRFELDRDAEYRVGAPVVVDACQLLTVRPEQRGAITVVFANTSRAEPQGGFSQRVSLDVGGRLNDGVPRLELENMLGRVGTRHQKKEREHDVECHRAATGTPSLGSARRHAIRLELAGIVDGRCLACDSGPRGCAGWPSIGCVYGVDMDEPWRRS